MCDFTEKYIDLTKLSCVLNCCSECPGAFVFDEETIDEDDLNLPFIRFQQYKKYKLLFCVQTDIYWEWKNMYFMHEYRKCQ